MRYCWGVKTADVLLALLPLFLSLLQHPLRPNGSQQFRDRARTTHTLPLADSIELRKRYGTVLCSYFFALRLALEAGQETNDGRTPHYGNGTEGKAPPQINDAYYRNAVSWEADGDQYHGGAVPTKVTTISSSNVRANVPPRRMDHTYHDWAQYPPDDYELRRSKKTANNFVSNPFGLLASRSSPVLTLVAYSRRLQNCIGSFRVLSMLMLFVGSLSWTWYVLILSVWIFRSSPAVTNA